MRINTLPSTPQPAGLRLTMPPIPACRSQPRSAFMRASRPQPIVCRATSESEWARFDRLCAQATVGNGAALLTHTAQSDPSSWLRCEALHMLAERGIWPAELRDGDGLVRYVALRLLARSPQALYDLTNPLWAADPCELVRCARVEGLAAYPEATRKLSDATHDSSIWVQHLALRGLAQHAPELAGEALKRLRGRHTDAVWHALRDGVARYSRRPWARLRATGLRRQPVRTSESHLAPLCTLIRLLDLVDDPHVSAKARERSAHQLMQQAALTINSAQGAVPAFAMLALLRFTERDDVHGTAHDLVYLIKNTSALLPYLVALRRGGIPAFSLLLLLSKSSAPYAASMACTVSHHEQACVRQLTASVLARKPHVDSLSALSRLMEDADPEVRAAAVNAYKATIERSLR